MEYYCGYSIDLSAHGQFQVMVEFQHDNVVLRGDSCNFTLYAGANQIAVQVIDFEDGGLDCSRRLEMYHSSNSSINRLGRYRILP